jgi:hypothetical protein
MLPPPTVDTDEIADLAPDLPDDVMDDFKDSSGRARAAQGGDVLSRKRWAR